MICLKSDNCNFDDLDFDPFLWSFINHGRYLTFIDIFKGYGLFAVERYETQKKLKIELILNLHLF